MAENSKRLIISVPKARTTGSVHWVIKGELAYAQRPGSGLSIVPGKTVDRWLEQVRQLRFKSLIVMLSGDEMASYYPHLGQPLIDYYKDAGFEARSVATQDRDGIVSLPVLRKRVQAAFKALPKPVLIHCNAGLERSQFAIRAVLQMQAKESRATCGAEV